MPDAPRRRASRRVRALFLKHLDHTGSVRAAALASAAPRSSLYKWRAGLPSFVAAWNEALGERPARRAPPPAAAPAPPPAPSEWIEIPGQGLRHVATVSRPGGP
jgi:glyoxylase-like metal-dependent hydrolase (beta-lactamase superfamily II)